MSTFGWQGLLVMGGVLPLVLSPALIWMLPESPRFLATRGADPDRIRAVLEPMVPQADLAGATFARPVKAPGSPVSQLFKNGLAVGTLLIWTTFFMSLLVFYLLSSWLPLLITTAGFSMENAALMGATLATGGTFGAIVIGWLMDRFEAHKVLALAYLVAGAFVILLGNAVSQPWLLVLAIFGAGFGVAGAQVGVNSQVAGGGGDIVLQVWPVGQQPAAGRQVARGAVHQAGAGGPGADVQQVGAEHQVERRLERHALARPGGV